MSTIFLDADGIPIRAGDTVELLTYSEAHDDCFKAPLIGQRRKIIEFGHPQVDAEVSALVKNTTGGYAYWPLSYVRRTTNTTRRTQPRKTEPKTVDLTKIQEPKWPLKRIKKHRKPQLPPMGLPISRWMDLD